MFRWYLDPIPWRHFESNSGGGDGGGDGEGGEGGDGDNAGRALTMTQAELDGRIAKAVQRAVRPFSDYQELKAAKDELETLRGSSQTTEQRLQNERDRLVRERDQAMQRATNNQVRAAVVAEAAKQGSVNPDDVAALIDRADLEITDTGVEGVEEAVRALLAAKPYLAGGSGRSRRSGAEMNGGQQGAPPEATVLQSQHREWLRTGQMTPERVALVEKARATGKYVVGR